MNPSPEKEDSSAQQTIDMMQTLGNEEEHEISPIEQYLLENVKEFRTMNRFREAVILLPQLLKRAWLT